MQKWSKADERGFGLLEIILAIGIVGVVIVSLLQLVHFSIRLQSRSGERAAAQTYLREGVEALRYLRDNSWQANIAPLSTGPAYFVSFTGAAYVVTTTEQAPLSGRYDRELTIADVFRDANSDIASSGTMDTSTKRINLRVSWWSGVATATAAADFYLADIFGN